jgi:hypothetical protein
MTAQENKYSAGKIYKLSNSADDRVYVGSTCSSLRARLLAHICTANQGKKMGIVYQAMRELGPGAWSISLVEDFPCETGQALRAREEHHRLSLGASLNKNRCHVGLDKREYAKQYYVDNRDELLERAREYYADNRADILARASKNYEANYDQIRDKARANYKENREDIIAASIKYYEEHRAERQAYQVKYALENRERLRERALMKMVCTCGRVIVATRQSTHLRTDAHQAQLKKISPIVEEPLLIVV